MSNPVSAVAIREELIRLVNGDLLGPAGGPREEVTEGRVRERYLAGMLAPRRVGVAPEEQDDLAAGGADSPEEGSADLAGLVLDMKQLAEMPVAELVGNLGLLASAYEKWIGGRESDAVAGADGLAGHRRAASEATTRCRQVLERIREGIGLLAADAKALDAFRFANRAMALQRVRTIQSREVRKGKVDLYRPERTRYVHANCQRANEPPVMPVRFMLACRNGHLEDFPWAEYVHRTSPPCTPSVLRLKEYGVTGDPADIVVQCDSCGARRRFVEVVGPAAEANIPACRSTHPHLRIAPGNSCSEPQKVVVLGASNAWFPVQMSALALPPAGDTLRQLVEEHWATLSKVTSLEVLKAFRAINQLPAFAAYPEDQLWAAIRARAQGGGQETEGPVDLKGPEWEILSSPGAAPAGADFRLREAGSPKGYERLIARTVLVERLREVRVLLGFTRIESPGEFSDGEDVEQPRMAPLSRRSPTWLPATEVRGEGLFIEFNEAAVQEWSARAAVKAQSEEFAEGHKRWRRLRRISPPEAGFPGMRYVLLHSFAHALMRQLALECGYAASSVRERIYARDPGGDEGPMAGVLIYTGAPDSEGTLGGLVNLGKPATLGRLIEQTMEQMRLCASDPLCAERHPADDELTIHGAACHACLFAPETACERGNRCLDRSVLVKTFSSQEPGFFDGEA